METSLAPALKSKPDYAVLVALDLLQEYDRRRAKAKRAGVTLPDLSSRARWIFTVIASYAWRRDPDDNRYRSFPSQTELHKRTRCGSNRTIPRAIAALEAAGLLKVTRGYNPEARKRSVNVYELIENPEAYQAIAARHAAKTGTDPDARTRLHLAPTPEEREDVDYILREYPTWYRDIRNGSPYVPNRGDRRAVLTLIRAYNDLARVVAMLGVWADPNALTNVPPAHSSRALAHAPHYLPRVDLYWREHGYTPPETVTPEAEPGVKP